MRDPELKQASSQPYVKFTLAVDRTHKDKSGEKRTDFINCVTWGTTAQNLAQYQSKGSMVLVEGQIQTGSYTDNTGKKVYTTDVVCQRIEYLSQKSDNNQQYGQYQQPYNQPTQQPFNQPQQGGMSPQDFYQPKQQPQSDPFGQDNPFNISSDDLPF